MLQSMIKLWAPLLACAQISKADSDLYPDLPEGVLHFALTKPSLQERVSLARRADNYDSVSVSNQISMFSTGIQIGSSNENVTVLVDTGSSDLWVMSSSNPYCSSKSQNNLEASDDNISADTLEKRADTVQCHANTQFDPSKSNSFSVNSTAFHISYGDGSFANGTYCQDNIKFGDAQIQKANFAYVNLTDSQISVWGIGLPGLESISRTYDESGNFSPTYSNLPMQMKQQGIIKQTAYSLWLNDVDATTGSLLFGGVDHSKYNGTLQTVPLISSYRGAKPNEMKIKLDKISVYQGSNSADVVSCSYPALLDSGTTYMMIPDVFLDAIMRSIGGVYDSSGACFATCGLEGGLTFEFSGAQIQVPFSEFEFQLSSSSPICQLGMLPNGDSLVLGDTFLRSAYVVYDLDNYEVSIAGSNYNATGAASIDAITSGVPSASQASGYSSSSVNNAYSTSIATFITGTRNIVSGGQITTGTIPTSSLSGVDTGTYTGETSRGGGGIFGTTFAGTTQATGSPSAGSSSTSTTKSKNAGVYQASGARRTSIFGSLFTSIFGALLYF